MKTVLLSFLIIFTLAACTQEGQNQIGRSIQNWTGVNGVLEIYAGEKLGAGDRITGPAVIEEVTTTLVVEPGWTAELTESGVYLLDYAG
jgi:hypothetical protein